MTLKDHKIKIKPVGNQSGLYQRSFRNSNLIDVLHQLVDVGNLEHHLRVVPHDALELEEDLQTLLVPLELLVAQAEVVQGLNAGGVVVQSNLGSNKQNIVPKPFRNGVITR